MKALKIIGWTLLGIVLAVVAVVTIACYVVFTPERLTPVARQVADKFISTEHEIGQVNLTFFSTFPRFGLQADGLLIINPKAGSQNDTVVAAERVIATVDVMEFLRNKNLHVGQAILDNTRVNFYIAQDGTTNLTDVFVTSPDTTEEDTTAFSLPFDELRVDGLRIEARNISFVDDKDTITASLGETELSAAADSWDDMLITLDAKDVCAALKGDTYADSLHVELIAPMAANLDSMHFTFDNARLAVNDFNLSLEGDVTLGDSIAVDANVKTDKWQIKPLLALVPEKFTSGLKDLDVDGKVQLSADIKGTYSETQMPLITAHLELTDGEGKYKPLPYTLRDMELNANADINLNESKLSNVTINHLAAKTKQSAISADGRIEELLDNMLLDLRIKLDANLPDFAYFLPEKMTLDGRTKGEAKVRIRLDDLTNMRLEKGKINADLTLSKIHYEMDSMLADLPQTHARIQIPNAKPSKPKVNWARIDLSTEQIEFEMIDQLTAALQQSEIQLEAGNVLSNDPVIYAAVGLQSEQPLVARMDTIFANVTAPQLFAYAEYDTKQQTTPQLHAELEATKLKAQMGEALKAQTGEIDLAASARYDKDGTNALLKWNPVLKVKLKNGILNMPEMLPEAVKIPTIDFNYSNKEMNIADSRVELGRSDLNLKGKVRNIDKWFRKEGILEGQLDIVSDHCDANQLILWFTDDEGSEEQAASNTATETPKTTEPATEEESGPFLVPTDVNLALTTHMREVEIFNQVAKDLKGGLYINDGTLILDEMGFVCRAAKLQLTAMYRSPRRNHLYLGLDYHMLDVDIDELLTMIPNLEQMVPMLSSFKGAAEFHLAAETYLNSKYEPKMSTLRGAASLTGKDLVVLDSETFSTISKLLMFNKKTENKIDSINAEMTIYKNEIDVYPLCVQMDNYMVALGGRHNTDMTFDYDINVLSPIYLGVNVSGNIDDLQIKLAKCKFAQDFKPHWYQKVDNQSRELRERIKQSMEKNVRINK